MNLCKVFKKFTLAIIYGSIYENYASRKIICGKYLRNLREKTDKYLLRILTKRMLADRQKLTENTYETYASRETRSCGNYL